VGRVGRLKGQGREKEEKGKRKGTEREGKGKGKGRERESEGNYFNFCCFGSFRNRFRNTETTETNRKR
jgi:hypothetical protein